MSSGLPQAKVDEIAKVYQEHKDQGIILKPYQVAMKVDVAPDTAKRVMIRLGIYEYQIPTQQGGPKVIPAADLKLKKPDRVSPLVEPFINTIDKMLIDNIKVMNVTVMKQIKQEGYTGKKTTLKTYLATRRPYIQKLKNPPLPSFEEEEKKPVKSPKLKTRKQVVHVLDNEFQEITLRTMRDIHAWVPEYILLRDLQKEGYTGKITMMGNFMRSKRLDLINEYKESGVLLDRIRMVKEDVNVRDRVKTRIYRELVNKYKVVTEEELSTIGITINPPKKYGKKKVKKERKPLMKNTAFVDERVEETDGISNRIVKVEAYKVEADGSLHLREGIAKRHLQLLREEKAIRQWCESNVRDNMPATEITELLVKALKEAKSL